MLMRRTASTGYSVSTFRHKPTVSLKPRRAPLDWRSAEPSTSVVTELTLPDMSGFEVLVHLVPRATHPEIAVLMLTHVTLPAMATFALNSGAQNYLIKSRVSGDYLDRAIQRAIAFVSPRNKDL